MHEILSRAHIRGTSLEPPRGLSEAPTWEGGAMTSNTMDSRLKSVSVRCGWWLISNTSMRRDGQWSSR